MVVADFITKAGLKIRELGFEFNDEISDKGESCSWKDVYLLSEAIKVVSDSLTTNDCIETIITRLNSKYSLESVASPVEGGIDFMTIDPPTDCNVFTIYE